MTIHVYKILRNYFFCLFHAFIFSIFSGTLAAFTFFKFQILRITNVTKTLQKTGEKKNLALQKPK